MMTDDLYTFRAEGCGHQLGNTLATASWLPGQKVLHLARISQTGQDIDLSRILNYICKTPGPEPEPGITIVIALHCIIASSALVSIFAFSFWNPSLSGHGFGIIRRYCFIVHT